MPINVIRAAKSCLRDNFFKGRKLTRPLGFTGNALIRWSEKRRDPQWLAAQTSHAQARFTPLWRGQPLISDKPARLFWAGREQMPEDLIRNSLLLGLDGDIPHFAIDVSGASDKAETAPFADQGQYLHLIAAAMTLPAAEMAIAGQAMGLLNWQRKNRFSPKTGKPMRITEGGFKLVDDVGTEIFPRINPVVMVLVVEGNACLMARNHHFPAGLYSALAGFVEIGESLEECARREVFEETGLQIDNLHYAGSQPWPLSDSLMIGFTATAATRDLTIDKDELEDAKWLARGEVKKLLAAGQNSQFFLPPAFSLAGHMIRHWCAD